MRCEGFWAGAGSRAMQSSSGPRPPAARRAAWFVGLGSVSPPGPLGHVAAAEPVLGAKPVEDTLGRVALLAQLLQILLQPLVDDLGEPVQLRAPNRCRPPIARRHLKTTASSLHSRAKSRNDAPRVWWFYADLKAYFRDPTPRRKRDLQARFDRLFTTTTGFATLDRLLARRGCRAGCRGSPRTRRRACRRSSSSRGRRRGSRGRFSERVPPLILRLVTWQRMSF